MLSREQVRLAVEEVEAEVPGKRQLRGSRFRLGRFEWRVEAEAEAAVRVRLRQEQEEQAPGLD